MQKVAKFKRIIMHPLPCRWLFTPDHLMFFSKTSAKELPAIN
jgi:hypothetical protein